MLRSVFELTSLVHLFHSHASLQCLTFLCLAVARLSGGCEWRDVWFVLAALRTKKRTGGAVPTRPGLAAPRLSSVPLLSSQVPVFFFPSQSQQLIVAPSCLTAPSPPLFLCPTSFLAACSPLLAERDTKIKGYNKTRQTRDGGAKLMSVQRTFRQGKSQRLKRFHMFYKEAVDPFLLQNKRKLLGNYNLFGFGHLHQLNKGIHPVKTAAFIRTWSKLSVEIQCRGWE